MKYKLLVLDVDGTLLNSEKEISKRTLAALLKVQQMGVRIVLASGRPTYGLMPLAKTLELGNYGGFILSYNGGQIINAQNGELLFERRINPEMLPYLEKKARKNGFAIFTYHDDTIITDSPENEHIRKEAQLNGLKIIVEPEFSIAVDFAPCKCCLLYTSDAADERVEATMPVDERTRQPFGILHGGATLALAETVAGLGSMILCKPDEIVVGMQVSGNHISSAHEGDTVRAVASIVHKGRSSHVWNVDVFTSTAKLVSSIRVVNSILKKG